MPFVVLEGVWALVALTALARGVFVGQHSAGRE
jgi:hypothetical protein